MLDVALDAGITAHRHRQRLRRRRDREHSRRRCWPAGATRSPSPPRPACYTGDTGGNSPLSPQGPARQRRRQPAPTRHRPRRPVLPAPARPRCAAGRDADAPSPSWWPKARSARSGVSNFAAWQIAEVVHVAERVGAPRPVVAQQLYNLLARRIEDEYAEYAAVTGLHHHGLQPARRRPAHRQAQLRRRRRPKAASATPGSPRCTASATGTPQTLRRHRRPVPHRRRRRAAPDRAGPALAASKPGDRADPARRLEDRPPAEPTSTPLARGPLSDDVVAACDDVGAALRGPMPPYNR